jgi:ubiquinone/menaquinone biosynthesis C-methylase UbiE
MNEKLALPAHARGLMAGEPDGDRAIASYRGLATSYESTTRRILAIRKAAIEALALRGGETVLDIGCGAGATLPMLAAACGRAGRVVGIEQSPDMARIASARVCGAANIEVVNTPVEQLPDGLAADAMLLCYTHDILQSRRAIERLRASAKPGCRVAVAGILFLPWTWGFAANLFTAFRARRYLTTYRGLREPWTTIAAACREFEVVRRFHLGTSYLGVGRFR